MSMLLLALEWGTDSVLALGVALVALGVGGLALLRTRLVARPFRRFRLVNKSKKRPIALATVAGAVASTIDLTLDDASPISNSLPIQHDDPNVLGDWDGCRCFNVNTGGVTSTSVTLQIKAQGSSVARTVAVPADLGLNWGNSSLESIDVLVTDIDDLNVADFGYTLQITVARYLRAIGTGAETIDVATKELVLPGLA